MEFIPLLFGSLVFFLFLYFYFCRSSTSNHKLLPPEPPGGLPFLGHLHLFRGGGELPKIKLGALADKHGPIFRIRFGTQRVTVISSSKLAKEIFTTNDIAISSRRKLCAIEHMGRNMFAFSPYGDYWRKIRKITSSEVLSHSRVVSLSPVCAEEITHLVKQIFNLWEEKKDGSGQVLVDMKKWFVTLNMNIMMKMTIGKQLDGEGDEKQRCRTVMRDFVHMAGMFLPSDALPWLKWFDFGGYERKMKKTAKDMDAIVAEWLGEHRMKGDRGSDKAEDFMDVMISSVKDSKFEGRDPDMVIISTCEVLIFGASETTSTMLIWILSLLLNHRHVIIKIQQELDKHVGRERRVNESDIHNLVYLQATIKESLRVYPPGPFTIRELNEDCTIGGYHIPKGSWLLVNLWKLQRDPEVWLDNPMEFKPERFLNKNIDIKDFQAFTYLPFGAGRRMCPGIDLAMLELHMVIANLLQGFNIATGSDEAVDMSESDGLTNLKATPLDVLVAPRLPHDLY